MKKLLFLMILLFTSIANCEIIDTVHTWIVAKDGDNGNSGHPVSYPIVTNGNAKLTIGAAITAASAGDTIIIFPGTYEENLTVNKQLQIEGTSRDGVVIQPSSGTAITGSADDCIIKNLSAIGHTSGTTYGIIPDDNWQVINCYVYGNVDGLYNATNNADNMYLFRCHFKSSYDGVNLGDGNNNIFDMCIMESTGSYDASSVGGYRDTGGYNNIIKDSRIIVTRALDGDSYDIIGCKVIGNVIFNNVSIYLTHTGTGAEHESTGIYAFSEDPIFVGKGMTIYINTTWGQNYGIIAANGQMLVESSNIKIEDPGTEYSSAVDEQVEGYEKTRFIDNYFDAGADDFFNDMWIVWTSGNNTGEERIVLDWVTSTNTMILETATTYDIEVDDDYDVVKCKNTDIKQTSGIIRLANSQFDRASVTGSIIDLDAIADSDGRVDVSELDGSGQSLDDLKDFADEGYDPSTNKVTEVATLTGHTAQTGDSYAIVNNGTYGNAAIENLVDDIGVAGAGLTAVVWNPDWDAQVQSEVDDALVANNLDHLMKTATGGADMTTEVADNTVFSRVIAGGDTSDFVPSTMAFDSLYGYVYCDGAGICSRILTIHNETDDLEDRLTAARAGYLDKLNVSGTLAHSDAASTYKATGFSTHSEADIWTTGSRELSTPANYKADVSSLALEATLTTMKGTTFETGTDSLEAIRDRGDAAWTGSGDASAIADAVWDEAIADHTTSSTFGGKNQKVVPSETIADYKATGFSTHNAAAVITALMADTGITAGGTYTYEDFCKAVGSYILGTWQDKDGDSSVQEILDWEDDSTVILEATASKTSPYKTTTKQ